MPLPRDRLPATLDEVAGRARRDLLLMGAGSAGGLLGVAAGTEGMSHFSPETISDADFAAAVRRGFDDMRQLDEVRGFNAP